MHLHSSPSLKNIVIRVHLQTMYLPLFWDLKIDILFIFDKCFEHTQLPFSIYCKIFPLSLFSLLSYSCLPCLALSSSCLTPLSHLGISMCQDKLAETHIFLSLLLSAHHSTGERKSEQEAKRRRLIMCREWGEEEQYASEERWGGCGKRCYDDT